MLSLDNLKLVGFEEKPDASSSGVSSSCQIAVIDTEHLVTYIDPDTGVARMVPKIVKLNLDKLPFNPDGSTLSAETVEAAIKELDAVVSAQRPIPQASLEYTGIIKSQAAGIPTAVPVQSYFTQFCSVSNSEVSISSSAKGAYTAHIDTTLTLSVNFACTVRFSIYRGVRRLYTKSIYLGTPEKTEELSFTAALPNMAADLEPLTLKVEADTALVDIVIFKMTSAIIFVPQDGLIAVANVYGAIANKTTGLPIANAVTGAIITDVAAEPFLYITSPTEYSFASVGDNITLTGKSNIGVLAVEAIKHDDTVIVLNPSVIPVAAEFTVTFELTSDNFAPEEIFRVRVKAPDSIDLQESVFIATRGVYSASTPDIAWHTPAVFFSERGLGNRLYSNSEYSSLVVLSNPNVLHSPEISAKNLATGETLTNVAEYASSHNTGVISDSASPYYGYEYNEYVFYPGMGAIPCVHRGDTIEFTAAKASLPEVAPQTVLVRFFPKYYSVEILGGPVLYVKAGVYFNVSGTITGPLQDYNSRPKIRLVFPSFERHVADYSYTALANFVPSCYSDYGNTGEIITAPWSLENVRVSATYEELREYPCLCIISYTKGYRSKYYPNSGSYGTTYYEYYTETVPFTLVVIPADTPTEQNVTGNIHLRLYEEE